MKSAVRIRYALCPVFTHVFISFLRERDKRAYHQPLPKSREPVSDRNERMMFLAATPPNASKRTLESLLAFAFLLLPEANRFFDSPEQLLLQRVETLVWRHVQTIEARMRLGKLAFFSALFNCESSWTIRALQVFEAVDRDMRCTSGKLQKSALLLCVPTANALPEVLHDWVILGVSAVVSVLLPVVDINVCYTTDEEFQLTLIEDVDEIGRDELVETGDESIELLLNALLDTPFGDKLNVLLLVLVRHFDIFPTRLQLHSDLLTKSFIFNGERAVNHVGDVVLHGPGESAVEFGIHALHVLQGDPLLEDHLVERSNEECVQKAPVEDGQTDHASNKLEVAKVLRVNSRVRVDLQGIVVVGGILKETIEGVKHLVG